MIRFLVFIAKQLWRAILPPQVSWLNMEYHDSTDATNGAWMTDMIQWKCRDCGVLSAFTFDHGIRLPETVPCPVCHPNRPTPVERLLCETCGEERPATWHTCPCCEDEA